MASPHLHSFINIFARVMRLNHNLLESVENFDSHLVTGFYSKIAVSPFLVFLSFYFLFLFFFNVTFIQTTRSILHVTPRYTV